MYEKEIDRRNRSRKALLQAIDEIAGLNIYGLGHAICMAEVTAWVEKRKVVQRTQIEVQFTIGVHSPCYINIHWEDHGIPDYHDLGLYGQMNLDYQTVKRNGHRSIFVIGETYKIQIDY